VPPVINDLLSDLIIECFNKKYGCDVKITYDALAKHECECGYEPKACKSCKKLMLKKEILTHEAVCDQAIIITECCFQEIKRCNIKDHDTVKCLKSLLIESKRAHSSMEAVLNQCKASLKSKSEEMITLKREYEIVKDTNEQLMMTEKKNQEMHIEKIIDKKLKPKKKTLIEALHAKPKCKGNHKLELLTVRDRGYDEFKCQVCNKNIRAVSWNCRPCGYDICLKCEPTILPVGHCFWGHKLKLEADTECVCDICYKRNSMVYQTCDPCNFTLCQKCINA
jgi:hypothetical protein